MRKRYRLINPLSETNKILWIEINDSHIVVSSAPEVKFMLGWSINDVDLHSKKFQWRIENDRR